MPCPRQSPLDPTLHSRWRSVRYNKKFATIRAYAEALIRLVREYDQDGRDIGFDYAYIRTEILRRFPVVIRNGPHRGKRTKMPYKELQELACDLNRRGVKLPFRPRRKAKKESST